MKKEFQEFDDLVENLPNESFSTQFIKDKANSLGIKFSASLCEYLKTIGYSQNGVKWTKVSAPKKEPSFRKFTFGKVAP